MENQKLYRWTFDSRIDVYMQQSVNTVVDGTLGQELSNEEHAVHLYSQIMGQLFS